jgi:hypothetical protein
MTLMQSLVIMLSVSLLNFTYADWAIRTILLSVIIILSLVIKTTMLRVSILNVTYAYSQFDKCSYTECRN